MTFNQWLIASLVAIIFILGLIGVFVFHTIEALGWCAFGEVVVIGGYGLSAKMWW